MNTKNYFEKQLNRSKVRNSSRPKEAKYVRDYLYKVVNHLRQIKRENPGITAPEMKKILAQEIDSYSSTSFESSYIFSQYMDYTCCKYLINKPGKFAEVSDSVSDSDIDLDHFSYFNCSSFDECLAVYVYNFKRNSLANYCDGELGLDLPFSQHPTQDDYKKFDRLFDKHKKVICSKFFETYYSMPEVADLICSDTIDRKTKIANLRKMCSLFKNAINRQDFQRDSNIFLNGLFARLPYDLEDVETSLRTDLANSTEKIVSKLDSLEHLEDYTISFVLQMCNSGFSDFVTPFCKNGMPTPEFINSLNGLRGRDKRDRVREIINIDSVKTLLSANFLSSSHNSLPIEALLAINSHWLNRYAKELDLYSEAMFAVNNFDIVSKIINETKSEPFSMSTITEEEISQMLIKMGIFYKPASFFLTDKSEEISNMDFPTLDLSSATVEDKIVRFSYEPFIEKVENLFSSSEYSNHFSQTLPKCNNDLAEDAILYIKLYNPIFIAYSLKDEIINSILVSITEANDFHYPNAGIILDSPDVKDLKSFVAIGIDSGLTSNVVLHVSLSKLIEDAKTITGNAIVPIYTGSEDFANITSFITPQSDKHKSILKKANKDLSSYRSPHLVSHLAFVDAKHAPDHLKTSTFDSRGREKKVFQKMYIDLESGQYYIKVDGQYVPTSAPKVPISQEVSNHEL